MKVDIRTEPCNALRYNLIDLDSMQNISNAVWADDETGEYGIIDGYFFGGHLYKKSEDIIIKKGNIKLVKSKY